MLILKGNRGKSRAIDIIADRTNSICFVYNDGPLIFDSIGVDSRTYSLKDFFDCIIETIDQEIIDGKHYDYLLVYTNQKEEDLQDIVNWIENNRWEIPCRDVILSCK